MFDDGRVEFGDGVVDAGYLGETLSDETGLVDGRRAGRPRFDTKRPAAVDDGAVGGERNKKPSIVLNEGVILLLDGDLPGRSVSTRHGVAILVVRRGGEDRRHAGEHLRFRWTRRAARTGRRHGYLRSGWANKSRSR